MDARRGATAEVGGGVSYYSRVYTSHVSSCTTLVRASSRYPLFDIDEDSLYYTCNYSCTSCTTTYEYIIDISLIESYESMYEKISKSIHISTVVTLLLRK